MDLSCPFAVVFAGELTTEFMQMEARSHSCIRLPQAHRLPVVDGLKAAVSKSVAFAQGQQKAGWMRKVLSTPPYSSQLSADDAVSSVFCRMVEDAASYLGWDLVGGGLIDLAFTLLDGKPQLGGRPDQRLKAMWKIGKSTASLLVILYTYMYLLPIYVLLMKEPTWWPRC